jgi:hypothetical protein
MWGSSGQPSEQRRLGRPVHALAAVIAILAFLVFSCPALASSAPTIERESVSGLTEHDATLEAQINTGGAATHYRFHLEYGCDISGNEACPQFCIVPGPCPGPVNGPVDIPLPSGVLPGSSQVEHVSLDLHEIGVTLEPATKYRYSIEATNTAGTAEGSPQFFTTPPRGSAGAAPSINGVSVSGVTEDGATMEAQINPGGLATTYEFWVEYGCGIGNHDSCLWLASKSVGHGQIAAGDEAQAVSVDAALEPGHSYDYWVVATNSDGETSRSGGLFSTPGPGSEAPVIESVSLSHLTATDATLEAQINTEGFETTYEFQMWSSPCSKHGSGCELIEDIPLPSGKLLGSFLVQDVSLDLNSAGVTLRDGEYGFSVKATNAAGGAERGYGQVFEPPEPVVQPLSTTTSPQPGASQSPVYGNGDQPAGSGGSGSGGSSSSAPGVHSPGTGLGKTIKLEPLTNAEKLAKALKQCKKEPKRKRAACEKQAHQKYASVAEKSRKG